MTAIRTLVDGRSPEETPWKTTASFQVGSRVARDTEVCLRFITCPSTRRETLQQASANRRRTEEVIRGRRKGETWNVAAVIEVKKELRVDKLFA